MTSSKEKKTNKIVLRVAFTGLIIAIILSLTGIVPLPRSTTIVGIVILIMALFVSFSSSKRK